MRKRRVSELLRRLQSVADRIRPDAAVKEYAVFHLVLYGVWFVFAGEVTVTTAIMGIPVVVLPILLFRHTYRIVGASSLFGRMLRLVRFLLVASLFMVRSSVRMAVFAVRPRLKLRSAILRYEPHIYDRLGLVLLAVAITVTPGTLVVDRDERFFYVHILASSGTSDSELIASLDRLQRPLAEALSGEAHV